MTSIENVSNYNQQYPFLIFAKFHQFSYHQGLIIIENNQFSIMVSQLTLLNTKGNGSKQTQRQHKIYFIDLVLKIHLLITRVNLILEKKDKVLFNYSSIYYIIYLILICSIRTIKYICLNFKYILKPNKFIEKIYNIEYTII